MKVCARLAVAALLASAAASEKEPEWATTIKSSFPARIDADTYDSCTLSDSEDCAFEGLAQVREGLVFPPFSVSISQSNQPFTCAERRDSVARVLTSARHTH